MGGTGGHQPGQHEGGRADVEPDHQQQAAHHFEQPGHAAHGEQRRPGAAARPGREAEQLLRAVFEEDQCRDDAQQPERVGCPAFE